MADHRNSTVVSAMADTALARAFELADSLSIADREESQRRNMIVQSLNLSNLLNWQLMVTTFHRFYHMPVGDRLFSDNKLTHMSDERLYLRMELIREEFAELQEAAATRNTVEMADALGDLIYVICGFAVEMGIDLSAVVREIHASNLTKLGADGKPLYREDGKVMKGPNYKKPRIDLALGWLNHKKEG